jgi:hypothetical protein
VVRPHFFLSFYFWLDTVAVLSLAFELPALRAVLLLGATQVGRGGREAGGHRDSSQGALIKCTFTMHATACSNGCVPRPGRQLSFAALSLQLHS